MAKCFNPTCSCKDLQIVREIILRCSNCNCAVKVESIKLDPNEQMKNVWLQDYKQRNERLLFTVMKNAE